MSGTQDFITTAGHDLAILKWKMLNYSVNPQRPRRAQEGLNVHRKS